MSLTSTVQQLEKCDNSQMGQSAGPSLAPILSPSETGWRERKHVEDFQAIQIKLRLNYIRRTDHDTHCAE